jgi:hypothetical protein
MKVGDSAEFSRTFNARDLADYVALCGGKITGCALPEPLLGALISRLLGMDLPGIGTHYLKQESEYHAVAKTGDKLSARVEITRLRPHKNLVDLATSCCNQKGELLLTGRALVHVSDVIQSTAIEN